jgi:predicted dehydrogenase/threonine dehydrogenase-like Zn-dependent dehydrogenase
MKQVFRTQQGIKVMEVPMPMIGDNDVLVKVVRSMISTGTETMTMKKEIIPLSSKINIQKDRFRKLKKFVKANGISTTFKIVNKKLNPSSNDIVLSPIGYSNSGIIVSIGKNILNFKIGDRVACAGSGIAAHAEYVAIPRNLAVTIPDNVTFEQAAMTTIGSIALQGLRRANVTFGDTVVITGLGLIGLLAVQIAKAWGLNVIALDIETDRIELAKKVGANNAFNALDPEIELLIKNLTNGFGADAVVICAATKSDAPVNQAMKLCRRKGTVTIVGAVGMNVEREQMYLKEIDLSMSTSYGPGRYDEQYEVMGIDYPVGYVKWTENRNMEEFVRLLSLEAINIEPLINKSFEMEEATAAFNYLLNPSIKPIGAMLSYKDEHLSLTPSLYVSQNKKYTKIETPLIKVGIIGSGGFVQGNHLPNLQELNNLYTIHAICDKNQVLAANLAHKYGAAFSTTDYHAILEDKSIDFVIIGTRHNLHSKLAIECLQAGKHVLVEKPLAMTLDELTELDAEIKKSDKHLTVGFNRRYSPFALVIKDIFKDRISPAMITYRINAGSFPLNNWIHDPIEGGGRIIGEACHFIDFISFVIDRSLVQHSFYNIPIDKKVVQANDNVAVNFSYSDGSVANMVYTSIGNKQMDKERIEIFCDNKSIVLDNFTRMDCYGVTGKNLNLKKMDKGFKEELINFAKIIKGERQASLSWDSIYSTTKVTIEIMNKITGKH